MQRLLQREVGEELQRLRTVEAYYKESARQRAMVTPAQRKGHG